MDRSQPPRARRALARSRLRRRARRPQRNHRLRHESRHHLDRLAVQRRGEPDLRVTVQLIGRGTRGVRRAAPPGREGPAADPHRATTRRVVRPRLLRARSLSHRTRTTGRPGRQVEPWMGDADNLREQDLRGVQRALRHVSHRLRRLELQRRCARRVRDDVERSIGVGVRVELRPRGAVDRDVRSRFGGYEAARVLRCG